MHIADISRKAEALASVAPHEDFVDPSSTAELARTMDEMGWQLLMIVSGKTCEGEARGLTAEETQAVGLDIIAWGRMVLEALA